MVAEKSWKVSSLQGGVGQESRRSSKCRRSVAEMWPQVSLCLSESPERTSRHLCGLWERSVAHSRSSMVQCPDTEAYRCALAIAVCSVSVRLVSIGRDLTDSRAIPADLFCFVFLQITIDYSLTRLWTVDILFYRQLIECDRLYSFLPIRLCFYSRELRLNFDCRPVSTFFILFCNSLPDSFANLIAG